MIDFSKPLIKNDGRDCTFIGGPIELRAGKRYVIYFAKTKFDDAWIGNCDADGNIGNPFGTHLPDYGVVANAPPKAKVA